MAHPYKGIPRKDWPKKGTTMPVAETAADVPRETPPAPVAMSASVPVGKAPIAPPRSLFTGDIKKLEVWGRNGSKTDPIPGFWLYWFLDRDGTGSRLFQAKRSGYEFVSNDEVSLNDVNINADLGSHVMVFGGTGPGGQPIHHHLMKLPLEIREAHQRDMQFANDRIEYELKRGDYGKQAGDGRYKAGPGSNLPEINISTR